MSQDPSVKVSALPAIVAANVVETDVLAGVFGGITSKVAISDLRAKFNITGVAIVTHPSFGAPIDGVSDCIAALRAAHDSLPATGGIIYFPATATNKWYCSDTWHITKPVRILGQMATQSSLVAPTGTILLFAADKTGIQFEGDTTFGDTIVASRGTAANFACLENIVVQSKGTKTGLVAGGTGVACDGIRVRAPFVRMRDFWVLGFKRDGVRIFAAVGSVDPTLKGNANAWEISNAYIGLNGGIGINVGGSDANTGVAWLATSYLNDGGGVKDDSFTGNTWDTINTFSNLIRSYATGNTYGAVNAAKFRDCYSEYTGEPKALIMAPARVDGGVLGQDGAIDPASTAVVASSSGVILRGNISHTNKRGAVDISTSLGYDTNAYYFSKYGAASDIASMDSFGHRWDPTTGWVLFDHKGSGSRILWEDPSDVVATPRVWTRNFRQGLLFGAAGDAGIWQRIGAGVPGAIPLVRGDISWESLPGINKPQFYRTNVSGSPGTQIPVATLDVFSGDRGDNSVTLVFLTDNITQRFNTPLTVGRTCTLPAGAANLTGVVFRVVREAGATGAFNLDVKNSAGTTLKSLTAAGQWAEFLCDGTTFRQITGGTL